MNDENLERYLEFNYSEMGYMELIDIFCEIVRLFPIDTQEAHIFERHEDKKYAAYFICKKEIEKRLKKLEKIEESIEELYENIHL